MFDVVLYQPEIPPNTGNVIRLCANSGCALHLIEPLGFALDDSRLRRAGLDYHEWAPVRTHASLQAYLDERAPARLFAFSTRATRLHVEAEFRPGDALLFGAESSGLPAGVVETVPPERLLRLPMLPDRRSINLSNAVAIAVYEAWRQAGFEGGR